MSLLVSLFFPADPSEPQRLFCAPFPAFPPPSPIWKDLLLFSVTFGILGAELFSGDCFNWGIWHPCCPCPARLFWSCASSWWVPDGIDPGGAPWKSPPAIMDVPNQEDKDGGGEGPPRADLQPRDSSGAIIQVHFGVSSSPTSHKILWLWIRGHQGPDLTVPPKQLPENGENSSSWKKLGMGW